MADKAKNASETVAAKKARKPYPDRDTRISMADEKIKRLEKINAERRDLIEKTETKLNERKAALAKSEEQLAKVIARREKLADADNKQPRFSNRAAKAAEKAQIDEIKAKLAAQGKTLEDILNLI